MAEMGFLPEITAILDLIPEGGQRLLFSATLDRGVDGLVERYLTDAVTHSTDEAVASVTTMRHHVLLIDPKHKKVITAEVANRAGRTLVFVRTKLGADRVAQQLREQGVLAAALHGGLSQGVRNRVLGAFRDGTLRCSWRPTSPLGASTSTTCRSCSRSTRRRTTRTTSTAPVARPAPARPAPSSRSPSRTSAAPMERQLRDAGVDAVPVKAVPGDAVIADTGGRTPTGVPVADDVYRRLLEAEKRPRRGPGGPRGPRGGRTTAAVRADAARRA